MRDEYTKNNFSYLKAPKRTLMRKLIIALTILGVISCKNNTSHPTTNLSSIDSAYVIGEFTLAQELIHTALLNESLSSTDSISLLEKSHKMDRIKLDFARNEIDILEQLKVPFPYVSEEKKIAWENSGKLEMKIIDGEKRYFKYAVNNLYRLDSVASRKRDSLYGQRSTELDLFRIEEAKKVLESDPTVHNWHIEFTIEVPAGTIPAGETLHCWMPFPKLHKRQSNVELVSTNKSEFQLADSDADQRSLYLNDVAIANEPTVFKYEAIFSSQAEWHNPETWEFIPYNKSSALFLKNTREEAPHIVFSDPIKNLADSLTLGLTEPYEIVKTLYNWISVNIPWASALEYSTFDCIPEYVLKNKHGDCGMVTFLFMSMARYKGIPVKWQSGWMLHPGFKNLHDWAEVYYEGIGWIPLDMSFGLQESMKKQIRDYYITGIDAYRLIVNDDISSPFNPAKKHMRSEPFDFQRGEVEWSEENLYFNKWDYTLKIIDHYEE